MAQRDKKYDAAAFGGWCCGIWGMMLRHLGEWCCEVKIGVTPGDTKEVEKKEENQFLGALWRMMPRPIAATRIVVRGLR